MKCEECGNETYFCKCRFKERESKSCATCKNKHTCVAGDACTHDGGRELWVEDTRASKQVALETAVRELLETVNKRVHDGFIYYETQFTKIENLRKAYKELSE